MTWCFNLMSFVYCILDDNDKYWKLVRPEDEEQFGIMAS